MISGILRDRRQATSHNSLTTKEVSESLLTSLMPEKEVEGTEGFASGIYTFIKRIMKMIADGFKWLWNAIFGPSGRLIDIEKRIKKLKEVRLGGELNSGKILYFVKREHWGDIKEQHKDLIEVSSMLLSAFKDVTQRADVLNSFLGDGKAPFKKDKDVKKVDDTLNLSHNLSISFEHDPKKTERTPDHGIAVKREAVTEDEAIKNKGFFYIDRESFDKIVKNLMLIANEIRTSKAKIEKTTERWESQIKSFKEPEGDSPDTEGVAETFRYLEAQFAMIKITWTNFTKELDSFISVVETFADKPK